MKTYPTSSETGGVAAFEVDNAYISPRTIGTLLRASGLATDVQVRRPFSRQSDFHLTFAYMGHNFVVWEPHGDSSRYWVGPRADKDKSVDLRELEAVFKGYEPSVLRKLFGALISLEMRAIRPDN